MWSAPILLFDGEDEEALKAEFIRLSAIYQAYSPGEIAEVVFKNLPDPILRSHQAASVWMADLEVKERIRQAKLNGGIEPRPILSKEQQIAQLQALADDDKTPIREKLAAHRLIAEMQGFVVKAVEKTVDDKRRRFPQVVLAQYAEQ
jgi:hypothetical protein